MTFIKNNFIKQLMISLYNIKLIIFILRRQRVVPALDLENSGRRTTNRNSSSAVQITIKPQ